MVLIHTSTLIPVCLLPSLKLCPVSANISVIGGSRYQSASAPATAQPAHSYQDPFTGSGGYHGAGAQSAVSSSATYRDPFTGASGYHGGSAPAPAAARTPSATPTILPVVRILAFNWRWPNADVTIQRLRPYHSSKRIFQQCEPSYLALVTPSQLTR